MVTVTNVTISAKTQIWCVVVVGILAMVVEVAALNGPNVCMVKQKYNITKRVKYRAPMSVRTYEWCMSIPPRCSKWSTEMRDLTRLETEERTAEVAVCCPGYKMKDVSCVPICPNGRTGHGCSQECPQNKWGPNCVNDCPPCSDHGNCSPITGECSCQEGWQGESCESRIPSTTSTTTSTTRVEELLTKKPATKPTLPASSIPTTTRTALVETTSVPTSITATSDTSNTNQTTSLVTASTSAKVAKDALVPKTASIEDSTVPMKIPSLKINLSVSHTSLIEQATVTKSPLAIHTTSTIVALKDFTTKAPATTPEILKTSATEVSTFTSSTKLVTTQMPIIENEFSTEIRTNKDAFNKKAYDKLGTTTTELYEPTVVYNNTTAFATTEAFKPIIKTTQMLTSNQTSTTIEPSYATRKFVKEVHVEIKTTPIKIFKTSQFLNTSIPEKAGNGFTEIPITTPHPSIVTEETKLETTRRPDATIRYFPTTVKFKPKEIWIRPAQKGESFVETKKSNHDSHIKHRIATNKEPTPNTTPKTIIVSIIPTSVSYATFKKIALTTSILSSTTNMTSKSYNKPIEQEFTKPMSVLTTALPPPTFKLSSSSTIAVENTTKPSILSSVNTSKSNAHFHKVAKTLSTLSNSGATWKNKTVSGTNSMTTVNQNLNFSNSITPTVSSTNIVKTTHNPIVAMNKSTSRNNAQLEKVTKPSFIKVVTETLRNVTTNHVSGKKNDTTKIPKTVVKELEKTNVTKIKVVANAKTNKITTERPDDEETFHILTEPEHITAIMEGKEKERTSVDLISVISIAGGIMMAVITVAVIIVMIERCRRPRYEDVRKMNDIHMQVMIDNNDVPPPYVRSIFHTPLPDPPSSEKCHYQPISTLDRNLKQFMRPVVVQTISPIMLENFRGILECHYDHLPRRSHDFEARQKHCSMSPSSGGGCELDHLRPCSIAESTIDALKCEARLDAIDSTTSEPLYAEIPCWRPPSEHAIEVMNINGEAVTEL